MIDEVKHDIEVINANIKVLPIKTKKNREKYLEYLNDNIKKYSDMLKDCTNEINSRIDTISRKYNKDKYIMKNQTLNYDSLKLSDKRVPLTERLDLERIFYYIEYSDGDLKDINQKLEKVFNNFREYGLTVTKDDFAISESVNRYICSFFDKGKNIQDVFNELYFKTPDIIKQIEINAKYLAYKNQKLIEKNFDNKYKDFDYHKVINEHRSVINYNDNIKHNNVSYLYDLFVSGKYDVREFLNAAKMEELSRILVDPSSDRNYANLMKLIDTLYEYKEYKNYEFITKDIKALYEHKAEYKDLFNNKLKEISKKESMVIGFNKKMNKTGFFRLSKEKLADTKLERNKVIAELINDYEELDSLKIKDTIYKYVDNETSCFDMLKLASYNYDYFVELLKKDNPDISVKDIDNKLLELQRFIYDNNSDILNSININDEKEMDKIICEKYKLNNINIEVEKLALGEIDKLIVDVEKLIIKFDIERNNLDLNEIRYVLDTRDVLK